MRLPEGTIIEVVVKHASSKKIIAFDGICRLKSTKLCSSRPVQADGAPAIAARATALFAPRKFASPRQYNTAIKHKPNAPPAIPPQPAAPDSRCVHDRRPARRKSSHNADTLPLASQNLSRPTDVRGRFPRCPCRSNSATAWSILHSARLFFSSSNLLKLRPVDARTAL